MPTTRAPAAAARTAEREVIAMHEAEETNAEKPNLREEEEEEGEGPFRLSDGTEYATKDAAAFAASRKNPIRVRRRRHPDQAGQAWFAKQAAIYSDPGVKGLVTSRHVLQLKLKEMESLALSAGADPSTVREIMARKYMRD